MTADALNLELVRTFLTVVETGGFKSAAEQLHKTPAAISQQIKKLESILGKRVLERSNQGIALTSARTMLKPQAEELLALNYRLLDHFRQHELAGQIRFGAPTDYAPTLLQKLLPIFKREFPRVSPILSLEPSRSLRAKIHAGSLDLAIVAREPEIEEGHALWTEQVAWFRGSGVLELDRAGLLTTDCVLRDIALQDLKSAATRYEVVLEAATVASLRDAVEAGFCHAILPLSLAEQLAQVQIARTGGFNLTLCLISSRAFDSEAAARVAQSFAVAL